MSQRMSRREMRKAGLLKPRPAAEPATDDDVDEGARQMEAVFTPDEAATDKHEAADAVAEKAEPVADELESDDADKETSDRDEATDAEAPDETDSPADGQARDDEPQADTVEQGGPGAGPQTDDSRAAEGADDGQDAEEQDAPVTPERTSVFERFSGDDDSTTPDGTEPLAEESDDALAGDGDDAPARDDDRTVAAEAVKPEDAATEQTDVTDENADEDLAGALRARLKSTPPEPSASSADTAEDAYDEPPSRWKTAVIFLLLIVVGFGVGILLGSLIFSGGSEASATVTAISDNFAYYLGAL